MTFLFALWLQKSITESAMGFAIRIQPGWGRRGADRIAGQITTVAAGAKARSARRGCQPVNEFAAWQRKPVDTS
jgi:hypothetical protein